MRPRNASLSLKFQEKTYQSPKYVAHETLHAHSNSVDETWRIIEPVLKNIGTTRLANLTGLDRIGIPVYNAVRPNFDGYAVAHGKGLTPKAAKLSAAMESLERYYGTIADFHSFSLTYHELQKQYPVIPREHLPLTSKSFFHDNLALKWTLGWDLIHQEHVAVPVELASLKIPVPPEDLLLFQRSSNGLAAGTDFLEAVAQALLEVIERDAITCSIMAARGAAPPPILQFLNKIRLETIPFPAVNTLIAQIEDAGIMLVLSDQTVNTAVPTYNCFLFDTIEPYYGVTHGMGSSLDPAMAMIRAITEAVQARAVFHAGARDIFFHSQYMVYRAKNAEMSIQVVLNEEKELWDASQLRSEASTTFEGDIAICLQKLQAVGIEQVIVFALTDPDSELCAVKVLVPALEGYLHPYYKPGLRAKAYFKGESTKNYGL